MDQNQPTKPPTSRGTEGVAGLKRDVEDAATTAREHVVRAGEELRTLASEQVAAAKETIVQQSAAAKDTTANELSRTAKALQGAANDLASGEEGRSSVPQSLMREAANGLSELSRALEGKSVGQMVGDVSTFGRRNPVAFMGAAALAGFALGRFARASERPAPSSDFASHGSRQPERTIGSAHMSTPPSSTPHPAASPMHGTSPTHGTSSPTHGASTPEAKPYAGRTPPIGGTTHG